MPKTKSSAWSGWEDMPIDVFRQRHAIAQEKAAAFVADMEELFPGLVTLTKEQRKVAPKLRDGEHAMLQKVLDVVDLKPALFESLADIDEGMDPKVFETPLLRERIEKHELFRELAGVLEPVAYQVSDSSHYLGTKFRDAVQAAYRIAKAHAPTDKKINDVLAPVIDFMRKNAVAGAATRSKNSKK